MELDQDGIRPLVWRLGTAHERRDRTAVEGWVADQRRELTGASLRTRRARLDPFGFPVGCEVIGIDSGGRLRRAPCERELLRSRPEADVRDQPVGEPGGGASPARPRIDHMQPRLPILIGHQHKALAVAGNIVLLDVPGDVGRQGDLLLGIEVIPRQSQELGIAVREPEERTTVARPAHGGPPDEVIGGLGNGLHRSGGDVDELDARLGPVGPEFDGDDPARPATSPGAYRFRRHP